MLAFAEQGLNACLYYDNKNLGRNVSLIPTSAITGEGIPDMIMLLVNLTQSRMAESLMYISELECTVLEVKVIEGLGTTIDVVLSNGYLREGDRIVVCGLNGPIYTNVRALLTPQPLREMRVKVRRTSFALPPFACPHADPSSPRASQSAYVHHKEVKAALGIKITAPDLEVMADLQNLMSWVDKSGRGVSVQASTLGSLEALLEFLRVSKIPVSTINIGPVHKRDVIQASTMVEKVKEYACMLCFDVPVEKEAEKLAQELGVTIFKAEIIYHLFDAFTKYNKEVQDAKRAAAAPKAIWPCRLKTLQVFARRDPIVLGVDILDGTLRVGTPLAAVHIDTDKATGETSKTIVNIGVMCVVFDRAAADLPELTPPQPLLPRPRRSYSTSMCVALSPLAVIYEPS
jgi:translation initiation factor 5B